VKFMKIFRADRAVPTAVIIPAFVIVTVLAVLQYRWTTQVSEATSVRLADTLQLSMINWHLDFFRNFSEICLTMRVDPETRGGDLEAVPFVRRYNEWAAIATYPDLVSNVYVAGATEQFGGRMVRLDTTRRRFTAVEWPDQLSALRGHLEASSAVAAVVAPQDDDTRQQFAESFYNIGHALQDWRFEPEVPALLYPIVPGTDSGPQPLWLIIELNAEVIRSRILPDLAHRYFQGTDGLDYQVAVVAGTTPDRVIYSSDAGFGRQEEAAADGRMDIFGRTGAQGLESPLYVFHNTTQSRGPTTAVGISWFPLLRELPQDRDWQLVVQHRRGGPLGAFVTAMHRRNLGISFGAILLLVISMGILIVVSTRAHRLAKLQMDFVTAVSHELRTPLTVISSAAENVAHGVVEGKDQLRQYGTVIANHARQLSGLVEEVLLFASTRDGHHRYVLKPLRVEDIVDATLAATDGLIQAARFTVERDLDPLLPNVRGDLLALSQCLQNLITNALKYGRDQRWLGISARVAEGDGGEREVQISVSDRGVGVDAADLPHIFEPFYRSESATAAQIHGTGLGLSLALRIAEAMGGRLTVMSAPGRGSTFTLHLPIVEGDIEAVAPAPAEALA
jgi:signal transduction histidine kinase